MRILILQNRRSWLYKKDLMIKDGAELTTIELDEGKIPMMFQNLMLCFVWVDPWIHGWKKNIHG